MGLKCVGWLDFQSIFQKNCYYVNDTILLLQAQEEVVQSAWWAMMTIEAISGIKINFEKTKMYPINLSTDSSLAQIYRCSWGSFPI